MKKHKYKHCIFYIMRLRDDPKTYYSDVCDMSGVIDSKPYYRTCKHCPHFKKRNKRVEPLRKMIHELGYWKGE